MDSKYIAIIQNKDTLSISLIEDLFKGYSNNTYAKAYIKLKILNQQNKFNLIEIKNALEPLFYLVEKFEELVDSGCEDALAAILAISEENKKRIIVYENESNIYQQQVAQGKTVSPPGSPVIQPLGTFNCQICKNIIQVENIRVLDEAQVNQAINCIANFDSESEKKDTKDKPEEEKESKSGFNFKLLIGIIMLILLIISSFGAILIFVLGTQRKSGISTNG